MTPRTITFPPSSADVWSKCPGSLKLLSQLVKELVSRSTVAADEGTAAHWAAEQLFDRPFIVPGTVAPNGVVLTESIIHDAQAFVKRVSTAAGQYKVHVEGKLPVTAIDPKNCNGKIDVWWYNSATDTLHIVDFKYGKQPVECRHNKQLALYAIAVLDTTGRHPGKVSLEIDQPRSRGEPSEPWITTPDELRKFIVPMQHAASMVRSGLPPYKPGEQCRYCNGRLYCEAIRTVVNKVPLIVDTIADQPAPVTPEQIGNELTLLKPVQEILQFYVDALEGAAMDSIKQGQPVRGWGMKPGRNYRSWISGFEQLRPGLEKLTGVKLSIEKPLSPAQAEKVVDKHLLADYIKSQPGSYKLTPVTDNDNPFKEGNTK